MRGNALLFVAFWAKQAQDFLRSFDNNRCGNIFKANLRHKTWFHNRFIFLHKKFLVSCGSLIARALYLPWKLEKNVLNTYKSAIFAWPRKVSLFSESKLTASRNNIFLLVPSRSEGFRVSLVRRLARGPVARALVPPEAHPGEDDSRLSNTQFMLLVQVHRRLPNSNLSRKPYPLNSN